MNLKKLERMLEVAKTVGDKVGDIDHMSLRNVPALLRLAIKSGLGVRVMHTYHAIRTPDHPAMSDGRRTLSYSEADREINRMANALTELGVKRRTPVVIALENSIEYMVCWFAFLRIGARVVHTSYRLKPQELTYILEHSGARLAVTGNESYLCAQEIQKQAPYDDLKIIHVTDDRTDRHNCIRYDRLLAQTASSRFDVKRNESSESIVYTSGTTGKPKGAVRDLGSFDLKEFVRVMEKLPMRTHDRQLVVTPLYHSAAQAFVLIGTAIGCSLRIEKQFDPATILNVLEHESIHTLFAIPTMLRKIVEVKATAPQLPQLRAVISGAAEFPHALREEVIRFFGPEKVFDFYGATELGWVTLIRGDEMLLKKGSVGKAMSGQEIAIFGEKNAVVPTGSSGIVYVRNDQTMGGYLNDQSSTDAITSGNWMTVDDIGHLDDDGYLYLSGRARDMVKSGGVNIYPAEIEEVLSAHPNIREVAVIGVPDKDWGERLLAVMVPRSSLESFDKQEVDTYMRTRVASFKIPKQWEVMAELPRNALGKVLKKELRESFSGAKV